jgi:outer membrane protein W
MKIKILIILFLIIAPFSLMAQLGYVYFKSDSVLAVNIKNKGQKKNALECITMQDDEIITYSPDEIFGYSFMNGSSYYSKEIIVNGEKKRFFVELITEDKPKLYYLNQDSKRFFVEISEDSLLEIRSKSNRKIEFDENMQKLFSKCEYVTKQHKYIKISKSGLTLFMDKYKSCEKKPFPRFKMGAFVGYTSYKYTKDLYVDKNNRIEFEYYNTPNFGIFIDQPLYLKFMQSLSFHFELLYFKQSNYTTFNSADTELDLVINTHSMSMPLLFKYTFNNQKISPFFSGGFNYTFNFVNDEVLSWATFHEDDIIELNYNDDPYLLKNQMGYVISSGMEYVISKNYSVFAEVRYSFLKGRSFQSLNTRLFSINIGLVI